MTEKKKIPELRRRALVAPDSINNEERTVEIVWTTGARARQWTFEGSFIEELEVSKKAVNLERLNSGNAPFLAMHETYDLSSVLGVVEKAWIDEENSEGRAIIRFAKGDEKIDKVWNLVAQRIIRNISVGYTVEMYEVYLDNGDQIYRAVKWTPLELSAVTVPADAKANVRAEALTSECVIVNRSEQQENPMVKSTKRDDDTQLEDKSKEEARPNEEQDPKNSTPSENEDDRNSDEENDKERDKKRFISRNDAILSLCEVAGLSISDARGFCKSEKNFEEIRADILAKRTQNFNGVNNTRGVSTITHAKTLAERAKEVYCKK